MNTKKVTKAIIILFVFLLGYSFLQAQNNVSFQPLKNLYGGNVQSIANVKTATLYAGTSKAIYRSTDHGATWERELSRVSVNKIVVYSKELILAATKQGLYARRGGKWDPVPFFSGKNVNDVGVLSTGLVFVSAVRDALYEGTVSLNDFHKLETLGYASWKYHISTDGTMLFVDMHMSADSGKTWHDISKGISQFRSLMALAANMADSLVLLGTDNGIYRYDFVKDSCVDLKLYEPIEDLKIVGSHVYAATTGGVYVSSNAGAKWQQVNSGLSSAAVQSICVSGDKMYAGTLYGLDVCGVNESTWKSSATGISETAVSALVPVGKRLIIGSSKGVLLTEDDGAQWVHTRRTDNGGMNFNETVNRFVTAKNGTLYAATFSGLYFSNDGGYRWSVYQGYSGQQIYDLAFAHSGAMLKATGDGVYRSTDGGVTWTKLNPDKNLGKVTCINVDGDDNIYIGTAGNGAYEQLKNGTDWIKISSDSIDQLYFYRLLKNGKNFLAATTKGVYEYDTFYKGWTSRSSGMGPLPVYDLFHGPSGRFYAATYSGLYRTIHDVLSWEKMDIGNASNHVLSVAEDSTGVIYFGTSDNGVYTSKKSLTGIPETGYEIQPELKGFPNPFSETTTVQYVVPSALGKVAVKLSVFDMLGKRLTVLVDRQQPPGQYSVTLRAGDWKPGTYFCRLTVGNRSVVKKLILMR